MSVQSISRRILFGLAFAATAVAPLAATSYVMVPDEALVDAAPLAVVGRIVSVDRSAEVEGQNGRSLVTEYAVAVEETLKGEAPAGLLRVRVPGGVRADGIALKIYGTPRFREDERALLFLAPDQRGGYRIVHLFLGAFHEVPAGERSLAVRNLNEASEMRVTAEGMEEVRPAIRDALRDFAAFARWVKERAGGTRPEALYWIADPGGSIRQTADKYTLFETSDGLNLRWFTFDTGGNVSWKAYVQGQQGVPGGGYSEFQTALQAWNAETQTPIDYRYTGTTSVTNGLDDNLYDELNTIVFNDPRNQIVDDFSCTTGGVLAIGGPWLDFDQTVTFQGHSYHPILNGDIVINDGLSCYFAASPNAGKAAEQLFGHELGHTLGLDHSCGDFDGPDPSCSNPIFDDALMRAFVHDDNRGARLNSDDQAGIRFLYRQSGGGGAPAAPTGLAATPSSQTAIHLTWNDNASNETEYRIESKVLGGSFADVGSAPANSEAADVTGLTAATGYVFRVRAHNASGFSAYSNEASAATNAPIEPCLPDGQHLCLNSGRFRVHVAWRIPSGETGEGQEVPVTSDDSGLLWFFNENNWEMLIKVLNACTTSPPRYWVFFAATTNVQYTVTVTDTQTGAVKAYFNPLNNSAAAVTDTNAFATCP